MMKKRNVLAMAMVSIASMGLATGKPNILWLTCEDNNVHWIGCYGNEFAETPNIDKLATEGFQYMYAYANGTVCSPSRSTWITGMYAVSTGTQPMRSRYDIPHDQIKYYPDYLKANGYYTGNSVKTDYNIGGRDDKECWDNPKKVKWEDLKENQPFFQVINSTSSHESRAFGDGTKAAHDPAKVKLWKYHPDLPKVRGSYALYHDAIKKMDSEIGAALQQLEELGLADNTIVIYNSDHGGVLPRSKRFLFESAIHAPLIIRIPEKYKNWWPAEKPGMKVERLVNFVDMPKTWLSLTRSEVPKKMQGRIFLGDQKESAPEYSFAFRGRTDERYDNARSVTDGKLLYIRNYMPYTAWMQKLSFLWRMEASQAWDEYVQSGKASEIEARFFAPRVWSEELYNLETDPDNVHNLIDNPEYGEQVQKMRVALRSWQEEIIDTGLLPESERVKRAQENNLTIYEMARDPKLYNLPMLLDAADVALEEDSKNISKLKEMLDHPDCGVRYWGMVGCFLLNETSVAEQGMQDESHEVRAMAAWLAVKNGQQEKALECLREMLDEKSYATLTILNLLDWMGDDAKLMLPYLLECDFSDKKNRSENSMKNLLLGSWIKSVKPEVSEVEPPAGTRYEAESAEVAVAKKATKKTCSGGATVVGMKNDDASILFTVDGGENGGEFNLILGVTSLRGATLRLRINENIFSVELPETGGWENYKATKLSVTLKPGAENKIELKTQGVNFDYIELQGKK